MKTAYHVVYLLLNGIFGSIVLILGLFLLILHLTKRKFRKPPGILITWEIIGIIA